MLILSVTDLHGTNSVPLTARNDFESADLVVLTGDLTTFGDERRAEQTLRIFQALNPNVVAVPGNCDTPAVNEFLRSKGVNLHGETREISGLTFLGLGGSLPAPGGTAMEFTEAELGRILHQAAARLAKPPPPFVLVSHQPPRNTTCDRIASGRHVGSTSVRSFIQSHLPLLCLTGHIHDAAGIDAIESTRIANPGPFHTGAYARAIIESGRLTHLEIRRP